MAIKIARDTPFGIALPEAYTRVVFFSGDATYVQYQVRTWANEKARQSEMAHVDERSFSFEYTKGQGDILDACYQDLKSRAEFKGGEDMLDETVTAKS